MFGNSFYSCANGSWDDLSEGVDYLADTILKAFYQAKESNKEEGKKEDASSHPIKEDYSNHAYTSNCEDKNCLIKVLVPEIDAEDIKVSYKKEDKLSLITVNILKDSSFYKKGKKDFVVPNHLDFSKLTAKVSKGLLTITIPKDESKFYEGEVKVEK